MFSSVEPMFSSVEPMFSTAELKFKSFEHRIPLREETIISSMHSGESEHIGFIYSDKAIIRTKLSFRFIRPIRTFACYLHCQNVFS